MSTEYDAALEKIRVKFKKEEKPVVKIDEEMLIRHLEKKFEAKGRDFHFKSSSVAKELNGSTYVVRDLLPLLEEKDMIKKTGLSNGPIIWITKLGNKK